MTWWNRYVGIPFAEHGRDPSAGVDCWGLALLIQFEVFGRYLPDLAQEYESTADYQANAELYKRATGSMIPGWVEVSDQKEGDVLVLKVNARPVHVGVVIGAPGHFIHCWQGAGSTIEQYRSRLWKSRVESTWRFGA